MHGSFTRSAPGSPRGSRGVGRGGGWEWGRRVQLARLEERRQGKHSHSSLGVPLTRARLGTLPNGRREREEGRPARGDDAHLRRAEREKARAWVRAATRMVGMTASMVVCGGFECVFRRGSEREREERREGHEAILAEPADAACVTFASLLSRRRPHPVSLSSVRPFRRRSRG